MNKINSFKIQKISLLTLVLVASFLFLPIKTFALTLTPLKFEISGDPGSTVSYKMTVINESSNTETLYSSYANFESKGDTGIPNFVKATDDLGTWISLPPSITIKGGSSVDVPIKISIPKNAIPGGHFAAIFWGNQPANVKSSQVLIGAKTGILVLLSVNGNVSEKAGITDFNTLDKSSFYKALPVNFYYRFQNSGGDRIKPSGTVVVKNMIGLTAAKISGNPVDGNILPNSTRRIETSWVGNDGKEGAFPSGFFDAVKYEYHNFALGYYRAHLDLTYGQQKNHAVSVISLWLFPWELIVVSIFLLALTITILTFLIRRYNKWVIARAEKMFEEHEAKMNHIKENAVLHDVVGPKVEKKGE
jgi:hypothetical protein